MGGERGSRTVAINVLLVCGMAWHGVEVVAVVVNWGEMAWNGIVGELLCNLYTHLCVSTQTPLSSGRLCLTWTWATQMRR